MQTRNLEMDYGFKLAASITDMVKKQAECRTHLMHTLTDDAKSTVMTAIQPWIRDNRYKETPLVGPWIEGVWLIKIQRK